MFIYIAKEESKGQPMRGKPTIIKEHFEKEKKRKKKRKMVVGDNGPSL